MEIIYIFIMIFNDHDLIKRKSFFKKNERPFHAWFEKNNYFSLAVWRFYWAKCSILRILITCLIN
jgi:hypothetical protein